MTFLDVKRRRARFQERVWSVILPMYKLKNGHGLRFWQGIN